MANIYKVRDFYDAIIKTLERYENGCRKVAIIGDNGEEIIPPQIINRHGTILKDNQDED